MPSDDFRKTLKAKKEALPSEGQAGSEKEEALPSEAQAGAEQEKPAKRSMDEGELMATAFAALTTGDVNIEWDAVEVVKEGEAPLAPSKPKAPPNHPPSTPAEPSLDPTQWQGRGWSTQDFFSGQTDSISPSQPFEQIHTAQLSPAQQTLLKKMSQLPESAVSTLSLRHLQRIEAMSLLRRHIAQMRMFGQRYLRIVTGKGIGSRGAPILRQEIVHWCILQAKQQALLWTPDLEMNGEYGAILVDLQGLGAQT